MNASPKSMKWIICMTCILCFTALTCCSENNPVSKYLKSANETAAMGKLKKLQISVAVYQSEMDGKFPTIKELYDSGGMADENIYRAWDGIPSPKPFSGYIFGDITEDIHGAGIDRHARAGYVAYPAEPGITGDTVILMIADERHFKSTPVGDGAGFISHGEEWTFYKGACKVVGGPKYHFPGDEELETDWTAMKKRTPEEAVQKARELSQPEQI